MLGAYVQEKDSEMHYMDSNHKRSSTHNSDALSQLYRKKNN
jgi:hypothetical protein